MSAPSSKPKEFLNTPLRLLIIWSSLFIFAFYVWSAAEARKNTSNRVVDWLPEGTKELEIFFNRYYYHFPEGELLMVSWAGCNEKDERLDEVAAILSSPREDGGAPYFARCLTTRSILEQLTADPLDLTRSEARARLKGWLIGHDDNEACLVALISAEGEKNRGKAIHSVFDTVEKVTGLPRSDIYVAGPTIDSVAIDEIAATAQSQLLPFFLTFCLILLLCCLRNFFAAIIIFGVALMNEELGGTLLYWTGAHVDSISMLISSLVYVLTISAGIHLINYYRETLRETDPVTGLKTDPKAAPKKMVAKAALPCSLAMITTVLGMGSLTVSGMVPIRTFGIYASIALFIGTAWLFLFVTATLQQYPIRVWVAKAAEASAPMAKSSGGRWEIVCGFVQRFRTPITLLALGSMVFLCLGVKNLKTTVTFHGMLPPYAKVIHDYEVLENRIGGLIPVEVVLEVPDQGNEKATLLAQLYLVQAMRQSIESVDGIETVVSALNFLPNLPDRYARTVAQSARRTAMTRILHNYTAELAESRFYHRTEIGKDDGFGGTYLVDGSYWRLSLRMSSQNTADYETLLAEIQQRLEAVMETDAVGSLTGLRFDVTGGVPLVHRAQQQLLDDLISSFITAFGLIALTMILMLRGVLRGLLAMIPNLFPCIIIFGALGWMNIPIDIGSMMTASVAMGIAVDGTLHYLTWFKIALHQGLNRRDAVHFAYRSCATALCQTTIICGFGMLVFGLSDFIPVSRFAIMMCLLLIASLIGDIIVLPAMLLGPLGKLFEPRKRRALQSDTPEKPEDVPV